MDSEQLDLAIVIPVFNDDDALRGLLEQLRAYGASAQQQGPPMRVERVVVDGAAAQQTAAVAAGQARYVASDAGRGVQIAAGISACQTRWIWVLHADTRVSQQVYDYVLLLARGLVPLWGRFDVRLEGLGWLAWFMNWRSRLSKICTGDQAMFFAADLLHLAGGFPAQPLMEDIEVSKRLKRADAQFHAPRLVVSASPRRWRQRGVLPTVLSMWRTRLRYFFGADPNVLYADYYGHGQ